VLHQPTGRIVDEDQQRTRLTAAFEPAVLIALDGTNSPSTHDDTWADGGYGTACVTTKGQPQPFQIQLAFIGEAGEFPGIPSDELGFSRSLFRLERR